MVPLPKWFLAIGLMVNAKKSLSSCQLARDGGLNTKTAWFMQRRIRADMAANEASLLQGIVEVDETWASWPLGLAAPVGHLSPRLHPSLACWTRGSPDGMGEEHPKLP